MNRLKETWWEKICYANRNHRNAELDILIPDQIGFKTKSVTRHEEVYFTVIKSLTIRERYHNNMRFIVEPWNTWSKNKQNWETNNSTTAVKDFIYATRQQQNYTEDQQGNRGLEKHCTSHLQNSPPGNSRTVFFIATGTLSSTDHVLGCEPSLSTFKKKGIMQSMFCKHGWMKLESNNNNKN